MPNEANSGTPKVGNENSMNLRTQNDVGCHLLNRTIDIRLCSVTLKNFGSLMSSFLYQSTKYSEPQGIHCIYTRN